VGGSTVHDGGALPPPQLQALGPSTGHRVTRAHRALHQGAKRAHARAPCHPNHTSRSNQVQPRSWAQLYTRTCASTAPGRWLKDSSASAAANPSSLTASTTPANVLFASTLGMPCSARKASSSKTAANLGRFSLSYPALVVGHHRGGSGAREDGWACGATWCMQGWCVRWDVRCFWKSATCARLTPTGQVEDSQHGVDGVHVA